MGAPDESDNEAPEVGEPDEGLLAFFGSLAQDRQVTFETDHGAFRIHLYESFMPVTTSRFVELVEGGFYDGTEVHRNVERFVVQGGDPTGTGAGGSMENVPHERHEDLLFGQGALGLARGLDEDSGDSQWFVTLTPQPHLSDPDSDTADVFGLYALFGQVVEGMDVVRSMNRVATIPGLDRPVEPPVIQSARVVDASPSTDLLGLPRTISDRVTVAGMGLDVDRPLHLFAGHPFQVGVYLRPGDGDQPPGQVELVYEAEGGSGTPLEEVVVLAPVEGDPWSFDGTGVLQEPGSWRERVRLGNVGEGTGAVEVHAWHPDYALV